MSTQKSRKRGTLGKKLTAGGMLTVGATAGVLGQSANTASAGMMNLINGLGPKSAFGKAIGIGVLGYAGFALKKAYEKVKNMYGSYKEKVKKENNANFYGKVNELAKTEQRKYLKKETAELPVFSIFGDSVKNKIVTFSNDNNIKKNNYGIIENVLENPVNNNKDDANKKTKVNAEDTEIGKAMKTVFEVLKKCNNNNDDYIESQYSVMKEIPNNSKDAAKLATELNSKFGLKNEEMLRITDSDLLYIKEYWTDQAYLDAGSRDGIEKNRKNMFLIFCEYICYLKNQAKKDIRAVKLKNIKKHGVFSGFMRKSVAGEYKGRTSFKDWLDNYENKLSENFKDRTSFYDNIYRSIFLLNNNELLKDS